MKWEDVKIGKSGIKCLKFPLSDEPRLGMWTIVVTEKVYQALLANLIAISYTWYYICQQINRGSCRYFVATRGETCRFEVKEFGKLSQTS